MNAKILPILVALLAWCAPHRASGQAYTNFIYQIQSTSGVQYDMSVASSGSQTSPLSINPGGATFQLWTVQSSPLTSTMLATQYVGSYVPTATVAITSADPYTTIPRTRCDKPFTVNITVNGLLTGVTGAPVPATEVTLQHYVQSYGTGNGIGINTALATLLSTSYITTNGTQTYNYALTSIPGSNPAQIAGQETFTVSCLADYQTPVSVLGTQIVQVWPESTAAVTGISSTTTYYYTLPSITITLTNLYPNSSTYAQVYPGQPVLGTVGTIVPGSSINIANSVPVNQTLTVSNWDSAAPNDGTWTLEILTVTPFGTDRLAYTTFTVNRSIQVNGSVNSMD